MSTTAPAPTRTYTPDMTNGSLQTKFFEEDALETSQTKPLLLSQVEVSGGNNLSRDFFSKVLSPLIEESDYTLKELLQRVDESYSNLKKTDIFSVVQPSLHVDYLHGTPEKKLYNRERSILTKVLFDIETKDLMSEEAVFAFNNEDNMILGLKYANRNANHNAEFIGARVNYRPYKPHEHLKSQIKLTSNLRNPSYKFILDLFNLHDNNQTWQENSTKASGGIIGVLYTDQHNALFLFNGLLLTKRNLYDNQDGHLKDGTGGHLKSAILSKASYTHVKYLAGIFPVSGFKAFLENEIASDQQQDTEEKPSLFFKTLGSADYFKSLASNSLTTHFFGELGYIRSDKEVHLSDKFYLGGFENFRGFARNSVNTAGGLQYYKVGATLYSQVPRFKRDAIHSELHPLRLYATTMGGYVGDNVFGESGVASVGAGLRYFNRWVHMDAGYFVSQRLNSTNDAGVRDGFKLELSLNGARSS